MIAPIKEKELAAFSLSSLERAPVRNLCLQPDLGIPLSYLDMGVYAVPSQPQALAPEDAALVQVDLMLPVMSHSRNACLIRVYWPHMFVYLCFCCVANLQACAAAQILGTSYVAWA